MRRLKKTLFWAVLLVVATSAAFTVHRSFRNGYPAEWNVTREQAEEMRPLSQRSVRLGGPVMMQQAPKAEPDRSQDHVFVCRHCGRRVRSVTPPIGGRCPKSPRRTDKKAQAADLSCAWKLVK